MDARTLRDRDSTPQLVARGWMTCLRRLARRVMELPGQALDEARYRQMLAAAPSPDRGGPVAAVVHVYYPELWPRLEALLDAAGLSPGDVFITTPPQKLAAVRSMTGGRFCVLSCPNRGRDVLPFLKVAHWLQKEGYEVVLKLHTKRSPHVDFGDSWSEGLAKATVPTRREAALVAARLRDGRTVISGAEAFYLPLTTFWTLNAQRTQQVIIRGLGRDAWLRIEEDASSMGFYAGTMFWCRLSYIEKHFNWAAKSWLFSAERGQTDGTMAHALERAFTLGAESLGEHFRVHLGSLGSDEAVP